MKCERCGHTWIPRKPKPEVKFEELPKSGRELLENKYNSEARSVDNA